MTGVFRRVIAGLILGPALLIGSFAWTGFLALRTVFDEDRSRQIAEDLLENDQVRDQIAENLGRAIENALPSSVEVPPGQIDQIASTVLADPRVEDLIIGSLGATHRAFLGQGEAPQELDLGPALESARTGLAAVSPAVAEQLPGQLVVELPTERIPDASPVKTFLENTVPFLAAIAVVMVLLALLTTSDRPSVLRRAARWAIGTTAVYLVLGFGVPLLLRAVAPDQAEVLAALLAALLRTTLVPSIVLGGIGAAMFAAAVFWPEDRRASAPEAVPAPKQASSPRPASAPSPQPQPAPHPARPVPSSPARGPEPAPHRPVLPTRARRPDDSAPAEPRPRWLPPTWVEGHGWVLDPADEREPPGNARFVEGVGWVVPGPPPDDTPPAGEAQPRGPGAS